MKKTFVLTAAIALTFGAVAYATTPTTGGTLALTGEVDGSIALVIKTSESNPITLVSGADTSAATATIAAVSYYGTADNASVSGFVKTHDSSNIILSGNFDVQVDEANLSSSGYTLTAALTGTDGNSWSLDGTTLSTSGSTPLSSTAAYSSVATQALVIKVPITASAGASAISNTINLTATAN